MADNSQLILAALAFLILYVLMHIRKERFLMHWLSDMGTPAPLKARKTTRKPARKRRKAGRR